MTTTRSILHHHLTRARFHTMVALYITALREGQSLEQLQSLWHEGFEAFGPEFDRAIHQAIIEPEESK